MSDKRVLRFNAPPTWPTPEADWQIAYLGWTPPSGWLPNSSASPAPQHWEFWLPNEPNWSNFLREARRPLARSIVINLVIFLAASIVTIIALANAESNGGYVIFWGAILFSFIRMLRAATRHRDISSSAIRELVLTAPSRIEAENRERYEAYLHGRVNA